MKIRIVITCGKRSYSEILDEKDISKLKDHLDECKSNGYNPHLKDISFDHYVRPIPETNMDSHNFNKDHFILGWMESLYQSDRAPHLLDYDQDQSVTTFRVEIL